MKTTVKKTLPKPIIKRIEEINKLIKYAADNDIFAIEYQGTWESVYEFKPIEYKNQFVTIAYYKQYKKKLIKERYNINNIFETVSSQLTWVKRCIEKGIRENKKDEKRESLTGNNMKPTAKQLEALRKGREARAKKTGKPTTKKVLNGATSISKLKIPKVKYVIVSKTPFTDEVQKETVIAMFGDYETAKLVLPYIVKKYHPNYTYWIEKA